MIIDKKHKFIFIHVYRTGGSSIDKSFGGNVRGKSTHTKLETIPNWRQYFSFAVIRNPWDRLVSSYHYLKAKKQFNGTWNEYVAQFSSGRLSTAKQHAQHDMVKNCSFIMRFEHLSNDFNQVCKLIGVTTPTLPHIWKTNHTPYVKWFTEEQQQTIHHAHQGDIEEYGFTFESSATKNIGDRR